MTASDVYKKGRDILIAGGSQVASFDTACLFEHFCNLSRADIISSPDVTVENADEFFAACKKRADGYPLQYILGSWEFMGLEFKVTPDVLIPRADTETLVEYLLKNCPDNSKILDMCCGSGCIGLAVKHFRPDTDVTLCDISEKALDVTLQNAKRLNLDVTVKQADLTKGGSSYFDDDTFDVIISNPPYIKSSDMTTLSKEVLHEPKLALCGGKNGTDFYFALIELWKNTLKPSGEMILESGYDTHESIVKKFCETGYCDIKTEQDLNGITRLVSAKKGTII